MLIILEGIDCSGKAVIGELILKNLPGCFFMKHGSKPKDSSDAEILGLKNTYNIMYHIYADFLEAQNKHLLVDRFYPSELVYSKPMRGYEASDDPYYRIFETEIQNANHRTVIIYVYATPEILAGRMLERGDDFIKADQIPLILDRYAGFINNTQLEVIPIRNELTLEEMTCQIKEQLIPQLQEF